MTKREALIRLVAGVTASGLSNTESIGRALYLYELIVAETQGPTATDHIGAYVNGEISE